MHLIKGNRELRRRCTDRTKPTEIPSADPIMTQDRWQVKVP